MSDRRPSIVIFLGAGRWARGRQPSALKAVHDQSRVLDWLLEAYIDISEASICFVGGYRVEALVALYPQVRFAVNSRWEETGAGYSLMVAPLQRDTETWISYADVVYRADLVAALLQAEGDVVVAVDRTFRSRYESRSRSDLDTAEKVRLDGDRILELGRCVPTADADAELAGVVRMSPRASTLLTQMVAEGLDERADLPSVLMRMLDHGLLATAVDVGDRWAELDAPQDLTRFVLGTKAESLERLRPLVRRGIIAPQVSFTVERWRATKGEILDGISRALGTGSLIVRSSAVAEDSWHTSAAGAFLSLLDVDGSDASAVCGAVERVVDSYEDGDAQNQVLVQCTLADVIMSGVVLTRTATSGAPYYVLSFDESTRTNMVTSGMGEQVRTVFLLRKSPLREGLPPVLHTVLDAVTELEELVGHDSLDVEFAVTMEGPPHVLQVRPIALARQSLSLDDEEVRDALESAARCFDSREDPGPFVLGSRTRFSVMTDWNPAEIIGTKPRRLSLSLYRWLITDEIWARQRAEYGYRDVRPCPLLVDFCGNPYVDVRASMASFVPADLPDPLAQRLVDHYLDLLDDRPQLHDKVEFEVAVTCLAPDFKARSENLQRAGFSDDEIERLRESLRAITMGAFARLERDLAAVATLQDRVHQILASNLPPLRRAHLLLADARQHGTLLFSHLARSAFVATSLLRGLRRIGVISSMWHEAFLASIKTVSSRIVADAADVSLGTITWTDFVHRYAHLRPGTYDITSPSYGSAPDDFLRPMLGTSTNVGAAQEADPATEAAIDTALRATGLDLGASDFLRFARLAIEGRESSKFAFTRNLSGALEAFAEFGAQHGVPRADLAHIGVHDLFALLDAPTVAPAEWLHKCAVEGREAFRLTQALCLPSQISKREDFFCYEQISVEPNYVTRKCVRAPTVQLDGTDAMRAAVAGLLVLIPNADPGFDWLFAHSIAGLITAYGGANSHMAIRAAEFGLPAAIGVGEERYQALSTGRLLELDCASRRIRVLPRNEG